MLVTVPLSPPVADKAPPDNVRPVPIDVIGCCSDTAPPETLKPPEDGTLTMPLTVEVAVGVGAT